MHKEFIGQTRFTFRMLAQNESPDPIFHLRYQVYCEELALVKPHEFPGDVIKDKYDQHALHFVAEDHEGIIACMRLIIDSPLGFPLEKHFRDKLEIQPYDLDHKKLGEASLLAISKRYRRRKTDGLYYSPDSEYRPTEEENEDPSIKRLKPMIFGVYRELYQECKRRGITHLYAIMDSSLCLLLRMHSFVFHAIGQTLDYYGPITPYFANLQESEYKIHQQMPSLMTFFLDGLEPQHRPEFPSEH
jgi:N-acyl amino acid synthase of PEP-CTERM/exosortase system